MNAAKRLVAVVFCLAMCNLLGNTTYNVSTVGELTAALAKQADGDVINIAAGTYDLTAQIELTAAVTVSGAGMGKTILRRDPSVDDMRIALLANEGAILEKMTLRDGVVKNAKGIDGVVAACGSAAGAWVYSGTIRDCELTACSVDNWGTWNRGTCLILGDMGDSGTTTARAYRCRIHGINGRGVGLALSLRSSNAVADTILIYDCRTNSGDGNSKNIVTVHRNGAVLRNATITDCFVDSTSVVQIDNNDCWVKDCIICRNTHGTTKPGSAVDDGWDIAASNGDRRKYAVNNFIGDTADPKFANPTERDYRLAAGSPCIDQGLDGAASITATDLTGETPRQVGDATDLGAYEFVPSTKPTLGFNASPTSTFANREVVFSILTENVPEGTEITFDFGDGTTDTTTGETITHAYATPGTYTVTATVESISLTTTRENYISIKQSDYDADSATLDDVMAEAEEGATIWLATGEYVPADNKTGWTIEKNVTIRSKSGKPEDVVFRPLQDATAEVLTMTAPNAVVQDVTIEGSGKVAQQGHELLLIKGGTLRGCVIRGFEGNDWNNHGAVLQQGGTVTHCVFTNNVGSTHSGGSAIHMTGGRLLNSLIANNTGRMTSGQAGNTSGGIVRLDGTATVRNCTIANNSSQHYPAIVMVKNEGSVENCLIYGNTSSTITGQGLVTSLYPARFANCVCDAELGGSCTVGAVKFKDAANGDYRVLAGSANIGKGDPTGYTADDTDLAGEPRLGEDGKVDAGCYQFVASTVPTLQIVARTTSGVEDDTVVFDIATENVPEGTPIAFDFGDGETDSTTGETIAHTYEMPGTFTVTAFIESLGLTDAHEDYITILQKNYHVDGTTLTLDDALARAGEGATIWLATGTYSPANASSGWVVNKTVTVRSESGNPEDVILKPQQDATKDLFALTSSGAVLQDVTLEGSGKGAGQYRVLALLQGGVLRNCVVRNYETAQWYAYGCVKLESGLVTHCVFTNNTGYTHYGASAVYLMGGTLEESLIAKNVNKGTATGAGAGGTVFVSGNATVRGCTVVDNTAVQYPAFVIGSNNGTVRNCLIYGNTSENVTGTGLATSQFPARFDHCVSDVAINDACEVGAVSFRDPAACDYHPLKGSANIGKGDPTGYTADDTDLAGAPRLDEEGRLDVGCYQYVAGETQVQIQSVPADLVHTAPFTVTFNAVILEGDLGDQLQYLWDYDGDGTTDETTNVPTVTKEFKDVVEARVTVTVRADKDYKSTNALMVKTYPASILVKPGDDLAAAVALGGAGTEIVLASGEYVVSSGLLVEKAVVLRGQTGNPKDVTLKSEPTSRTSFRTLTVNKAEAEVRDLTVVGFSNGAYARGGCLQLGSFGGTISNCVICGGAEVGWGGYGGGISISAGLVTHCVVSNCLSSAYGLNWYQGGGSGAYMLGGEIRDTLFTGCGYEGEAVDQTSPFGTVRVLDGRLVNCTVAGNAARACAGVWSDTQNKHTGGQIVNTVVSGNSSTNGEIRAWSGPAANFVNCLTDTDERINETCLIEAPAATFLRAARGNWRLSQNSVAVNAGKDGEDPSSTDLRGRRRVVLGRIDLGCYEHPFGGLLLQVK